MHPGQKSISEEHQKFEENPYIKKKKKLQSTSYIRSKSSVYKIWVNIRKLGPGTESYRKNVGPGNRAAKT